MNLINKLIFGQNIEYISTQSSFINLDLKTDRPHGKVERKDYTDIKIDLTNDDQLLLNHYKHKSTDHLNLNANATLSPTDNMFEYTNGISFWWMLIL